MSRMTGDVDEVVRREQLLLDPAVRSDAVQVGQLLHPDFLEFGRSGRVWDYQGMVEALSRDPSVTGTATDFALCQLSDDVVLLTYRTADALRSSVWVRDGDAGWRLRFHQGTLVPASL